MDQILVDNRKFFMHHVHWTPPLILIVLSRLGRGIQSATEMLLFKQRGGVAHSFNCTPAGLSICILLMHLFSSFCMYKLNIKAWVLFGVEQFDYSAHSCILLLIYDAVHNAMTSQQCNTNPYCMVVLQACIHAPMVRLHPKPKIIRSANGSMEYGKPTVDLQVALSASLKNIRCATSDVNPFKIRCNLQITKATKRSDGTLLMT